jgi:hypothetical protein
VRLPAVEGAYLHVNVMSAPIDGVMALGVKYELERIAADAVKGEDGKEVGRIIFDDDVASDWERGAVYEPET